MRWSEINESKLLEMAYFKKKAEAIITAFERPLNQHLLKIMCFKQSTDLAHWCKEVTNWLNEISDIRIRPQTKPGTAKFYFSILYDEPFGGVEEQNIAKLLQRMIKADGYQMIENVDITEIVNRLRTFHTNFANRCATGLLTDDEIIQMVNVL